MTAQTHGCAACGHENPERARFCLECGAVVTKCCARCGVDLPPAAKFCLDCGAAVAGPPAERAPRSYTPKHLAEKILQSKSALEGERKQVTVLFADVKGSMELAESLDPEEWHRILDGLFAVLSEGVHRFEGTVNQYTGDGIMALFGAPIAHEDHAARACYAALHLSETVRRYSEEQKRARGIGLSLRIGLNSGEVIVGRIGDDLRMDYTAQGHVVGLAQRMEQLADPGKVYLTEHVAAHVSGYFRLRELGEFPLRGVREPVSVCELEGVGDLRTRLDLSRARGFSRFVGRAHEQAVLEAALERALAGQGQVIGVVAEPGTGKSRLCYELAQRCRARGIAVHESQALSHGRMIPFLPLLALLRSVFGVRDGDSSLDARRKIAGTLALLDRSLEPALPLLLDFLGLADPQRPAPSMDPEARQRQLVGLVQRLVRARPSGEPALLVLEDLHWLDGGSEAFLEGIVESVAGTNTLLLVNFRPEYHARWMQRSWYQQLPLSPLGREAIDEFLAELLGRDATIAGLAERIRERTAGNPFFIEEIVRSLAESGALEGPRGAHRLARPDAELVLPATVHAVLAARIDLLASREKQVLGAASVIGREFAEAILRRVLAISEADLGAALRALVAAELIFETALYPEAEYAFKHPLTQEVAYRSQLAERRAETHRGVARAILEAAPGREDEVAAVLAHHFDAGLLPLEAARWHERAARRVARSHREESLRHWQRVRELARGEPAEATERLRLVACTNMLDLIWRLGDPEAIADEIFAEGSAIAERSGDRRRLAQLQLSYGALHGVVRGSEALRLHHNREGLRLAREIGDGRMASAALSQLCFVQIGLGDLAGALETAAAVLRDLPDRPSADWRPSEGFVTRISRAQALVYLGQVEAGRREHAVLVAEAEARGHSEELLLSLRNSAQSAWLVGDAGPARSQALRSIELAERISTGGQNAWTVGVLGAVCLSMGDFREGLDILERGLASARARNRSSEQLILAHLAVARLGLGDPAAAREYAREAVELGSARGSKLHECYARIVLARALRAVDGISARPAIEAELERAEALIEETGARIFLPLVIEERAQLARLLGDEPGYERALRDALELWNEMGASGHAERLAREIAP